MAVSWNLLGNLYRSLGKIHGDPTINAHVRNPKNRMDVWEDCGQVPISHVLFLSFCFGLLHVQSKTGFSPQIGVKRLNMFETKPKSGLPSGNLT